MGAATFGKAVNVVVGSAQACIRMADGTVWCWGHGVGTPFQLKDNTHAVIKDAALLSLRAASTNNTEYQLVRTNGEMTYTLGKAPIICK